MSHLLYSRILTPPVKQCINAECLGQALVSHHAATVVTIFTLTGPELGLKYALRCSKCSYIFHYAKYGRKTTVGERFYAEPREVIEVSDVTYCERDLYEMFCSLRYISV